jgi:nucleotide-binding universal stress UspA family protein
MFDNVLVGVDGRPSGRDAIALAAALADPRSKLTLAHVHSGALRPTRAVTPGRVREEQQESERLLEQERAEAGVTADLASVVAASPGRGLHERAEQIGADLLVVGSCRHGRLGRAVLGGDARSALNGAPCAVAVAVHGYAEASRPLATIGIGYDDSPESKAALAMAVALAERDGARVLAREVVTLPTYSYAGLMSPALGESVNLILEQEEEHMRELAGVEGRAVYGPAGEELAAFGDELDLLVVGSRGYGPLRRMLLGSTSSYLASHARCSLLVLPRVAAAPQVSKNGGIVAGEARTGSAA